MENEKKALTVEKIEEIYEDGKESYLEIRRGEYDVAMDLKAHRQGIKAIHAAMPPVTVPTVPSVEELWNFWNEHICEQLSESDMHKLHRYLMDRSNHI